jgi:adenosylcobinamide-GDP ribazoletransferase
MRSFLVALQFLTVCPWFRVVDPSAEEIGEASAFFPLVGVLLGAILSLVNWLLAPYVPAEFLSALLVTLLVLLTRGLHLDGLADTFDGLGAGGDREHVLMIMDDSRTGVFGVLAIVLIIAFKLRAIAFLNDGRWQALLSAPVLGRWAMVVLGYKSQPAREGLGKIIVQHMRGRDLLIATIVCLTLVLLFLGRPGVGIVMVIFIFSLGCKGYLHHRIGGVTGDTFGAVGELSETSALVLLALAQQ